MIVEIIGEEIPVIWLAVQGIHGNQVGRVFTVSQELEAHTWSKWLTTNDWQSCRRESDDTVISTFENTSVGMCACGYKFDLAVDTNGMNVFSSKGMRPEGPFRHCVSRSVEGRAQPLEEDLEELEGRWVGAGFG